MNEWMRYNTLGLTALRNLDLKVCNRKQKNITEETLNFGVKKKPASSIIWLRDLAIYLDFLNLSFFICKTEIM